MTSTYAFRVFSFGVSVLTLVTTTSSFASASVSQVGGKSHDTRTAELTRNRITNDAGVGGALVAAITAYEAARDKAVTAFQTVSRSTQDAYQAAIGPAALARKTALESANTSLRIALDGAASENGKAIAKAEFKAAVRAANDSLIQTNESARTSFKGAIKSAEQTLKSSLETANALLRQAVSAARTVHPSRTSKVRATPAPSTT